MSLVPGKKAFRAEARIRRAGLAAAMPDHAQRLAAHAVALNIPADAVVGGYAALSGEADPALLIARLRGRGCRLALPRVAAEGVPLAFHRVDSGVPLAAGAYGIPEPDPSWPLVRPSVVLVPLLAFDVSGNRLGYGGGYYDRTLAALRAGGQVVAIGVAFAGQAVENLPVDDFDEPLDMVLTEHGPRAISR